MDSDGSEYGAMKTALNFGVPYKEESFMTKLLLSLSLRFGFLIRK
jgi:hypothetical protein